MSIAVNFVKLSKYQKIQLEFLHNFTQKFCEKNASPRSNLTRSLPKIGHSANNHRKMHNFIMQHSWKN